MDNNLASEEPANGLYAIMHHIYGWRFDNVKKSSIYHSLENGDIIGGIIDTDTGKIKTRAVIASITNSSATYIYQEDIMNKLAKYF